MSLQVKLKSLMDGYTTAMQKVKDDFIANRFSYTADKLEEVAKTEREKIKLSFLQQAGELGKELESSLNSLRISLRDKKYPNLFNKDSSIKIGGELQIREARELADSKAEIMIQGLQSALELDRFDLISYFIDNYYDEVKKQNPDLIQSIEAINNSMIKKINAGSLINEINTTADDSQINKIFIERVNKGHEYTPYPYTIEFIKKMPQNVVSADLEKVTSSMEMRSSIDSPMP